MRKGSWSPSRPRSPTGCSFSANGTCGRFSAGTRPITTGGAPTAASNSAPARPSCRRPFPEADPARSDLVRREDGYAGIRSGFGEPTVIGEQGAELRTRFGTLQAAAQQDQPAGIDGLVALTSQARAEMAVRVHATRGPHQPSLHVTCPVFAQNRILGYVSSTRGKPRWRRGGMRKFCRRVAVRNRSRPLSLGSTPYFCCRSSEA
jgi:hypothetical protein